MIKMRAFLKKDSIVFYLVIGTLSIFAFLDLYEDALGDDTFLQILFEGLIFAFAIMGIGVLFKRNFILKEEITTVKSELLNAHSEAKKWKEDHQALLSGLGEAINQQFRKWGLSSSEAEIALFILKGLSFKEISEIRGTNEKTVRQQSIKVYEKSGLSGRSELSAFFLEDILSPIEKQTEL